MRKLSQILAVSFVLGSGGVALADHAHRHVDPREFRALVTPQTFGAPVAGADSIYEDAVHDTRTGGPSGGIN